MTFKLHQRFDANPLSSHKNWSDWKKISNDFKFDVKTHPVFPENLLHQISDLNDALQLNLTKYREELSKPLTTTDLHAFLNHIESVTKHVLNRSTADALDRISVNIRNIINKDLAALQHHRSEILYKTTTIEINLQPYLTQNEQLLNKLNDVDKFLRGNETKIVAKVTGNNVFKTKQKLLKVKFYFYFFLLGTTFLFRKPRKRSERV